MKPVRKIEKYSASEYESIRACARDQSYNQPQFREEAVAAHRAMITRLRFNRTELPYGDVYFEFMREIDNPCPDYGLRAAYRKRILEEMPCDAQR